MNKLQETLNRMNILIHQIASAVETGDTVDMSWVSRSTDDIEKLIKEIKISDDFNRDFAVHDATSKLQ